jgi:hypothetical protein
MLHFEHGIWLVRTLHFPHERRPNTHAIDTKVFGMPKKYFHHRRNSNDTSNSICHGCYMRVATAGAESELHDFEGTHVCDPIRRYQVSEYGFTAINALASGTESPRSREAWN